MVTTVGPLANEPHLFDRIRAVQIGWQEIVFIFLIIAMLTVPGVIALAIVLLVLRHQRRKKATPPPISSAD
jgi:hypothetical protein